MPTSVSITFLSDKRCVSLCQRWIFFRGNARLEASHRYSSGSVVTRRNHSLCRTRWLYWIWWERCWEAFNRYSSSGHPSLSHSFCFLPNGLRCSYHLDLAHAGLYLGPITKTRRFREKCHLKFTEWRQEGYKPQHHLGKGLILRCCFVFFFVGGRLKPGLIHGWFKE